MPRKSNDSLPTSQPFWVTMRDGLKIVWSAGSYNCVAMGASALSAALLTPVTILALAAIVNELNTAISAGENLSNTFMFWILIVAGAALVGIFLSAAHGYSKMRLMDKLSLKMQMLILDHASLLDASVINDPKCQEILERANKNPGQKIMNLLEGLIQSGSNGLQIVTLIAVLFWIEPWWTLGLTLAILPILGAAYLISQLRYRNNRLRTEKRRWASYYTRLLTHRSWSQTVRMFGLSQIMRERYQTQTQEIMDDHRKIGKIQIVTRLLSSLILLMMIGGALWYAAQRAASGDLNVGMFTAFWMAAWRFRDSAGKLGTSISRLIQAKLEISNLNEFLDLQPRMSDNGSLTPVIRGQVSMHDVYFRYSENSADVLKDINLDIHPGEIVALVGPNGAGKTTLAKLIARLYEPTSGRFLLDGIPIEEIKLDHYYQNIALVQQDTPKFEATAGENIAFGDWNHLAGNTEDLRKICSVAGVDQLIDQLPSGFDTMLGRMFGEFDLSGGQWKKIAIARTLARDRRIVILDEPAANLDIQTERLLHQQLKDLLSEKTGIIISHHFSSVKMADRIIVMVDGGIEEQGTHQELLDLGGVYASMYKIQKEINAHGSTDQKVA
ncbi:ABC transporter ATP-binding protein/permease [Planctomycetaceae bacterium]|nr:ABC transporter ATP-binding protein/permease [Planctomycetaceae bacterium]